VGVGDELLLVDLDEAGAAADLARHAGGRAHEVWPPLDRLADRGGRRVEAVVAVVRDSEAEEPAAAPLEPVRRRPAEGWITYKLFGPGGRQDDVLLWLTSFIAEAQADGLVERWHFLRYAENGREHLRVRLRPPAERALELLGPRLREHLQPLREAGAVVALETAEYFPEHARYGGAHTFAVVERLFELDSELVLRLLAVEAEAVEPIDSDRIELLARAFDALGRGLGLDLAARQGLAARQRAAHAAAGDLPPGGARALDGDFRTRQRRLAALLAGTAADPCSAPLDAHATRVQALVADLSPNARSALIEVLPPVLHVCAVRLLGASPGEEAAAHVFWERTLEGLAARKRRSGDRTPVPV
jgi:thiopeptide-type bacteriocin biosynthesis protein